MGIGLIPIVVLYVYEEWRHRRGKHAGVSLGTYHWICFSCNGLWVQEKRSGRR